jgi:hypothetical protein
MAGIQSGDFDSPDETRTPEKTRVDVLRMGDATAARFTFEPGWKWSECVKPVVGTRQLSSPARRCRVLRRAACDPRGWHRGRARTRRQLRDRARSRRMVVGDECFVGFESESRSAEEYARQ